jgi:hypothetical protein
MSGRFYRLTEAQSQQWISCYPQLAPYYDHKEYDWEDDTEGDEIYLIPEHKELILHIALSEFHTTDYSEDRPREGYWHCRSCARYALPESQRNGDYCVDCVIKNFTLKRV